ncbi:MAG: YdcF family protein [Candidatus Pristimantibacillus sp.]
MTRIQLKKLGLLDAAIIIICLSYFLLFGSTFGFLLIGLISFIIVAIRRIDLKKHIVIRRILITCFVLAGVSFVIIESFVVSQFGANEGVDTDADYVVVLGAGLRGAELSQTLKFRLDRTLSYVSNNQNIPIIVSGGQGADEDISEAEAMNNYLVSYGISQDRIILENKSTSTEENLLFSKEIMKNQGIDQPSILLVTSDFHMFRAKYIARKLDYEVSGLSSNSPLHLKPKNMIREYFAMVKTWL